jgi:Type I restriction-modification system methyltransferase subunit
MTETAKNMIDRLVEKLNKSTLINSELIANILFLCIANKLCVTNEITACNPEELKGRIFAAAKEKLIHSENENIADTVEFLNKYSISNEAFRIAANEILGNSMWKACLSEIVNYLIDRKFIEEMHPEFQTEQSLNTLALAILNPVNGTFYDGVAGGCKTAIEAFKYSVRQGGNLEIYTQELTEFLYHISVVRSFIENIPNIHQAHGDTIELPAYGSQNTLKTFDYSIMFPPIGLGRDFDIHTLGQDRYHRFDFLNSPNINNEWMFALHQISSLSETGKGVICMSGGSLFNAQTKEVRARIIACGLIECIISFPPNTLGFSAIPINLVVFNMNRHKDTSILMIDAQKLLQSNWPSSNKKRYVLNYESILEISKIYSEKTELDEVSRLIPVNQISDDDILPTRYINKITVDTEDFGVVGISPEIDNVLESGNWIKLEEVAEIFPGVNNSKVAIEDDTGPYKIVKLSDVQSGTLDINSTKNYRLIKSSDIKKYLIRDGDTIVSCKGPAVKVCLVTYADENMMISGNFIGIRPKLNAVHPLYLKYFLESPLGIYLMKSKQVGSSIIMIKTSDIRSLPIPYIPLESQVQLVSRLQKKEKDLEEQIALLRRNLKKEQQYFYDHIGVSALMNINEEKVE